MSRIGKLPIAIPAGVTVDIKDGVITVKGKLGELSQKFGDAVVLEMEAQRGYHHGQAGCHARTLSRPHRQHGQGRQRRF